MVDPLWLDFETKSRCDLKAKGAYNYAQDASTDVLCMSYAFGDGPVTTWLPDQPFPDAVRQHTGLIYAHNAAFERLIFWYVLHCDFAIEQFYCTAAQARANCGPGSLEDVGRFAGAGMRKDHRGSQLIRLLSVPQADGTFRDDPDLMAEMVKYCEQDVRAMRAVSQALRPLSADELHDYHVNERINDRGITLDRALALAAIRYSDAETVEIQDMVHDITEGAVPSVRSPRMREWVLARVGPEARRLATVYKKGVAKQSMDKSVRASLLVLAEENPDEVPYEVADVIQCADDLWASSVAKFARAADLADDEDDRVRGAFVFAGGAATGRASSYGLQVHNFPRKCAADPDAVRQSMVRGHQIVPRHGPRVTDVLKRMLRPALVAAPGHHLVVADWAAIEARVTPWASKSNSGAMKLAIFESGEDVYKHNAAATFRVSYDEVDDRQRQIGKVQELACLSEDTLVLTDNGAKAIVDVQLEDKLWDGNQWVTHRGLVHRGLRPTINVCGVSVTEDHLLLAGHEWIAAKTAHSSRKWKTRVLATGSANLPSWVAFTPLTVRAKLDRFVCNALAAHRRIPSSFTTCLKGPLRGVTPAQKSNLGFGARTFSNTQTLARTTTIAAGFSTGCLRARTAATTLTTKITPTMVREASRCMSLGGLTRRLFSATSSLCRGGISPGWNWIVSTLIGGMSRVICASLRAAKIWLISGQFKPCRSASSNWKPVYDIANAGPNNRFTVLSAAGPMIVHNCGFAGGVGAFAAMGRAYGVLLPEHEARRMVDGWRVANPWSVPYWTALERAYLSAMRNPGEERSVGRVTYLYDRQHLWYALPSGRVLCYPYARFDEAGDLTYAKASWKPAADATEWPRARLWRGLACENITQAIANDLLRVALRKLDDAGEKVVLHVHDEVVLETRHPDRAAELLVQVMRETPAWAAGLPLNAEVHTMTRYGKG